MNFDFREVNLIHVYGENRAAAFIDWLHENCRQHRLPMRDGKIPLWVFCCVEWAAHVNTKLIHGVFSSVEQYSTFNFNSFEESKDSPEMQKILIYEAILADNRTRPSWLTWYLYEAAGSAYLGADI